MSDVAIPIEETNVSADERSGGPLLYVAGATLVLALVMTAVAGWLYLSRDSDPGDSSVDAGFARDMSTHHAQAVQMAGIVYRRTEDPAIRDIAYDIMTTQQAQIGMMGGWLALWGLPAGGEELPMTWMGHGMSGPMPGMATDEQVASLETLPPADMDRTFLQLMIEHHKGGLEMANYAAQHASEKLVRTVARSMAESQTFEIDTMQKMLAERGG